MQDNQAQGGPQETRSEAQAPTLDIPAIRRAAQEGLPVLPGAVVRLCDRVVALEGALRPFAEQDFGMEALLAARKLLGLPDFPPLDETFAALREAVGSHFDGIDPVAFVAELRGGDEAEIISAAHVWADAVERCDGVVAAEEALLAAIRGRGG